MAKNWTVAEATEAILNGNKEAILDIGKRFPLAVRAIAIAGDKAKDILAAFNFVTVRKVESVLKDGVEISDDADEGIDDPVAKAEEKPKRGRKPKKESAEEPKKRGRKAKTEEPMNAPETDEEDDDTLDYDSMSEVELFKVCKAKGLKPAPKQKKQYYLDLLNPTDEDSEDDWDEEEEEEKPVKKTTKKTPAKKSKKAAEDEDDDWDI